MTGAEHRIQVVMPEGYEHHKAEIASARIASIVFWRRDYFEPDRHRRGVGCDAGSLINSAGSTSRTVASLAMISSPG